MTAPVEQRDGTATPSPTPGPIRFRWLSTIRDIDERAWNTCFPARDVMQSYELHRATEAARLSDVEFHYLIARDPQDVVVAIVPCFAFRMSLTVVAPDGIARVVAAARRFFPDFLYQRAFVVGTPVAICKDLLGIHPELRGRARQDVLRAICREVKARSKRLGLGLILVKEITSKLLPEVKDVLSEHFTLVESPATTYLYLGEPGRSSYRKRLRKKYRSLMNNRQARLARAGMRWEMVHDFSRYAEQMHSLYLQVLHHSKIRFETLSTAFFAQLPAYLGERVFALLCFQGERLVAFELFLQDDEWIHPIYLGMDYACRDEGALYFNCIYQIVEVLEARGKSVVQLGQTSYPAKASMGAVVDRLYLAIHHTQPAIDALLRRFGPLVFPPTEIPRAQRVFRDMVENDEGLARHGVHFERADA